MSHSTDPTGHDALAATDEFYAERGGFGYDEKNVTQWVREHLTLPKRGRVLDLCCGDGIWSKGIKNVRRKLELFGIDISDGGVIKARKLLKTDSQHFVVGDTEAELPFPEGYFDVIFARGPGLYCQHDMDRGATIKVIEMWHRRLTVSGRFYSVMAARPEMIGQYTQAQDVALPFIQTSRRTSALDANAGHYHHSIQSFLTPFWKARNVAVVSYRFFSNQHFLVTRRAVPENA